MSQVVSFYFGGAGINIGKACLEQTAQEHGIGADGFFKDEAVARQGEYDIDHLVHFREDSLGRWTPRSIFLDSDRGSIEELRRSEIGQLLEPGQWKYGEAPDCY